MENIMIESRMIESRMIESRMIESHRKKTKEIWMIEKRIKKS